MADYEFKLETKIFKRNLVKVEKDVIGACNRALKKVATLGINRIKKLTPWKTGDLRRSWFMEEKEGEITIYNNKHYASHIEYGHRTRNGGFAKGFFMMKKGFDYMEKITSKIINTEINTKIGD